jgi:hypothetical protein
MSKLGDWAIPTCCKKGGILKKKRGLRSLKNENGKMTGFDVCNEDWN